MKMVQMEHKKQQQQIQDQQQVALPIRRLAMVLSYKRKYNSFVQDEVDLMLLQEKFCRLMLKMYVMHPRIS